MSDHVNTQHQSEVVSDTLPDWDSELQWLQNVDWKEWLGLDWDGAYDASQDRLAHSAPDVGPAIRPGERNQKITTDTVEFGPKAGGLSRPDCKTSMFENDRTGHTTQNLTRTWSVPDAMLPKDQSSAQPSKAVGTAFVPTTDALLNRATPKGLDNMNWIAT
ncbi:hypothetical protein LTR86_008587 [Recurvomyces mirabilis]|nr:hypothetical protein LTR86_008587 [Recurvomyces mirabilis]